jgi:hypothetical protein
MAMLESHPGPMEAPGQVTYLRHALVGALALLTLALLRGREIPVVAAVPALLALWLCLASVTLYVALRSRRDGRPAKSFRGIPLLFAGPTGRFALRRRGDGRQVDIIAGSAVVAEVRATDLRDEIDLHLDPVGVDELDDLGSALGQAMDMVVAADEAHEEWDDHGATHDMAEAAIPKTW